MQTYSTRIHYSTAVVEKLPEKKNGFTERTFLPESSIAGRGWGGPAGGLCVGPTLRQFTNKQRFVKLKVWS